MLSQVCCWYTTHGHAHAAFYGTPLIIPHPDHSSLVCPGVTLLPIMVPSFLLDFGETRYPPEVIANGQRKAASDSNDLPAPPLSISGLRRRGAIDTSAECELREPRRRRCVSGSARAKKGQD